MPISSQALTTESTQAMPSIHTLSLLPNEIIAQVVSHLDQESGLSFALVSRHFNPLADKAIWRHLDISFDTGSFWEARPSHDCPLDYYACSVRRGRPNIADTGGRTVYQDEYDPAPSVSEMEGLALAGEWLEFKVDEILQYGQGGKLGLVETVQVNSRPEAIYGIMQILEAVCPALTGLHIMSAIADIDIMTPHEGTLDFLLVELFDSSFTALTFLTIHLDAIRFVETLPILCAQAPNLCHLEIEACETQFMIYPSSRGLLRIFSETKLRRLRIVFLLDDDD